MAEPYATYEEIQEGTFGGTVEIRSDLMVDVDADGRVLGVERIADEVRARDLEDVLRACVLTHPYRQACEASGNALYLDAEGQVRDLPSFIAPPQGWRPLFLRT